MIAYERNYFKRLGISEDILYLMASAPSVEIRSLTEPALLKLHLATEVKDVREMVGP